MIQHSVQFSGIPSDDPNPYIANFLEICYTFIYSGVIDDAIRLKLFPFSLRELVKLSSSRYHYDLGRIGSEILSEIFLTSKNH